MRLKQERIRIRVRWKAAERIAAVMQLGCGRISEEPHVITHDDESVASKCSCVGWSRACGVRSMTAELARTVYLSQSKLTWSGALGNLPGSRARMNWNGSRASTLNLHMVSSVLRTDCSCSCKTPHSVHTSAG